jgi:hypothetical protein
VEAPQVPCVLQVPVQQSEALTQAEPSPRQVLLTQVELTVEQRALQQSES